MSDSSRVTEGATTVLSVLRGREKPFDEPGDYYEATIVVRMQTVARSRYVEDDLRCVADRAAYAAAAAYNLANTRITAVRLERIEPDE